MKTPGRGQGMAPPPGTPGGCREHLRGPSGLGVCSRPCVTEDVPFRVLLSGHQPHRDTRREAAVGVT